MSSRQWHCQTCHRLFQSQQDLSKHIDAYTARVTSIQSRMQDLMAELQQTLMHSGYTDPTDTSSDELTGLYCPHPNCQGKAAYTELRSIQRHYSSHIPCQVKCPCCGDDFVVVKTFENHLGRCVSKNGTIATRKASRALKRRLLRETRDKLALIIPQNQHDGIISQKSQGAIIEEPDTGNELPRPDTNTAAGVCNLAYAPNKPNPSQQTEHFPVNMSSVLIGGEKDFDPFAAQGNGGSFSSRLARGPALTFNPMDWSYSFLNSPLYVPSVAGSTTMYPHSAVGHLNVDEDSTAVR